MIDKGKVIYGLENQLDDLQKYADNDQPLTLTQDQAKDILNLLKEQEAVPPKEKAYAWRCGKCDEYLTAIQNHRIRYCPYCGQAVKWNDT